MGKWGQTPIPSKWGLTPFPGNGAAVQATQPNSVSRNIIATNPPINENVATVS